MLAVWDAQPERSVMDAHGGAIGRIGPGLIVLDRLRAHAILTSLCDCVEVQELILGQTIEIGLTV